MNEMYLIKGFFLSAGCWINLIVLQVWIKLLNAAGHLPAPENTIFPSRYSNQTRKNKTSITVSMMFGCLKITVNKNTVIIMVMCLKLRLSLKKKKLLKDVWILFIFSHHRSAWIVLKSVFKGPRFHFCHTSPHISGWHFSWWFNTSPGRPKCVIFTNVWLQLKGIALIVACAMLKWSGALWSQRRLPAIKSVALHVPCVILQVVLQREPCTCFGK